MFLRTLGRNLNKWMNLRRLHAPISSSTTTFTMTPANEDGMGSEADGTPNHPPHDFPIEDTVQQELHDCGENNPPPCIPYPPSMSAYNINSHNTSKTNISHSHNTYNNIQMKVKVTCGHPKRMSSSTFFLTKNNNESTQLHEREGALGLGLGALVKVGKDKRT
ncbi:hypothetical protein CPB84DRAFT_1143876 [Gymnopilus junonius]|uniref:Uncharacterized protein n=1 Tax=Gymnopilus junonius TaxID=109634 RepID=A0A9P5NPH3_GYMJU|nr:hypothetical protein CPB84DRAFT_1143876 [Gymnopilus junonius]